MSTQPTNYITPEQYLEIDRKAEFKSEYINGEMFAMSGGTLAHSRLATSITLQLGLQLRHGPCEVVNSDMRVVVNVKGLYVYPDVTVFCGEPKLLDGHNDALLNPTVIVEVLSPSTEAYDRGKKFKYYREIASFREYLLVSSESRDVELQSLQTNGKWALQTYDRLDDIVALESIGCRLALKDLYEKIEFGERPPYMRPMDR